MLSWIGTFEIAFVLPVIRSVSSEISCLTAAAWDRKGNESSVFTVMRFNVIDIHNFNR